MADITQQPARGDLSTAQGETPRMRALKALANQLPVANSQIAQGQQAARNLQLQQAVQKSPVAAGVTTTAQQTGTALAGQQGQQMVEQAQQGIKQAGQVGQLGLQEQARQAQAEVAGLQAGAQEQQMDNVQRLAGLSEQAKQELYDKQMQFQKDQNGRTIYNAEQLNDYAVSSAKNQEEYKNYAQAAEQVSQRKLQTMETAYAKIAEDLNQKQRIAEQKHDQVTMKQIAQQKHDMEIEMQKQRSKAANNSAMWTTGGTIVGGAVGAVFGGPAGAMVGASAGGALGGMAGSQMEG